MSSTLIKQLHTLDSFLFSYSELNRFWGCDKRYGADNLQRFLSLNRAAFDFLSIKSEIQMRGNEPSLRLQTSKFAGAIPLLSPKDGKPCGNLSVGGRFGEDISELLSLISDTILPEYSDTLPTLSSSLLKPPLYFECCNYIDKWEHVEKAKWRKFDVEQKYEKRPTGGTRWDSYSRRSYLPNNVFRYPNRNNKLTVLHSEFIQLLSVLFICIEEVKCSQTPMRSRIAYSSKISKLESKYNGVVKPSLPSEFIIHASDPIAIKEAKSIANLIIQNMCSNMRAWRIDYSIFFERYVQFLFSDIAKYGNIKTFCNPHYSISGKRPSWALHYLEPDLILQKEQTQFVIDGKYKSHIFNWNENSEELKNSFRHDLHQILAYCSFNPMQTKKAILVYPFKDFSYHKLHIDSPITNSKADIYLVGIPLTRNMVDNTKKELNKLINS